MTTRAEKLAEIKRMIETARTHWASGLSPDSEDEQKARIAILEAIAEDYKPRADAPFRARLDHILEAQQVEVTVYNDGTSDTRILGIATTAEAIMALIEGKRNV